MASLSIQSIERARRAQWAAPLLIGAAVLVYLWPLALHPLGVAYPPGSPFTDLLVTHLPNADYARRTLWETGQWPLWNAQLFGGQPFAADPLGGIWYPPAWLLLMPRLPLVLGFNVLLALHLGWGGLGVYCLLRAEGLMRGPALLGALGFAGAPKLVAHLGAGHVSLVYAVAWTPWLLAATRKAAERGGLGRGTVAGAVWALVFLADVRWAFYAGVAAVGYAAWLAINAPRRGEASAIRARVTPAGRWQRLLPDTRGSAAASALTFAALLSAVLALPLAEFVRHSNRTALTLAEAAIFSLPPANLLGLILRNPGGFHEHVTYGGTITLLLALVGLGRRTLFWSAACLLAAAFALGSNFVLFPLLFRVIPGMGLLRVPPRVWFVAALGLCVLAGHGAQRLTQEWWPRLSNRYIRVRIRLPRAETALGVMIVLGVLDLARFDGTLLEVRPMPALAPSAAWLRAQLGQFRVYSPSYSLPAGDGLEHVDGVDPLQLASTVAFVEAATGVMADGYSVTLPAFDDALPAVANRDAVPDAERLGLLNVRYVAAEFPLAASGLIYVRQEGTTWLYENQDWRPRAWVEGGEADVTSWTPNRIEIRATGPGRLVTSEVAYPGWQARVDGQPVAIEVAHGLLRAVDLGAGTHEVVFTFRPLSVYAGAALTVLGLVGLAGLWWRERRAA
jgi:hypothetical protein